MFAHKGMNGFQVKQPKTQATFDPPLMMLQVMSKDFDVATTLLNVVLYFLPKKHFVVYRIQTFFLGT